MYAIYGNIYHQYTPFMLAYIPAPWILWDMQYNQSRDYVGSLYPNNMETPDMRRSSRQRHLHPASDR